MPDQPPVDPISRLKQSIALLEEQQRILELDLSASVRPLRELLAHLEQAARQVVSNQSGGISAKADRIDIGGDVVGRDKIVQGFTADEVDALLTHITSTFQPKPFTGRCPYVGLRSFDESNADLFFGRETLIHELAARLQSTRVVFITGPSGSGKSSLVRAGLIPALKRQTPVPGDHHPLNESSRWDIHLIVPTASPLAALAASLTHDNESVSALAALLDDMARDSRSLSLRV